MDKQIITSCKIQAHLFFTLTGYYRPFKNYCPLKRLSDNILIALYYHYISSQLISIGLIEEHDGFLEVAGQAIARCSRFSIQSRGFSSARRYKYLQLHERFNDFSKNGTYKFNGSQKA